MKNRNKYLLIIRLFVFLFLGILIISSNNFISAFAGGNGTSGNPWQINNCSQLQMINDNSTTLNAFYILIDNIDCSDTINWNGGQGFVPIGTSTGTLRFFGTFDGQDLNITNLFISRSGTTYQGLFGSISTTGIVKNFGLTNASITGGQYTGGLAGRNYGEINNTFIIGNTTSSSSNSGGLVGQNEGTVSNSYATGKTSSSSIYVGGLVGYNSGTIVRCYATGQVLSSNGYVGGLSGYNSGTITDSYATGNVSYGTHIGGLVGYASGGTITRCYSTGYVNSTSTSDTAYVGGLIGYGLGTTLINQSYSIGNVSAAGGRVGGLVGNFGGTNSKITDSYAKGNVHTSRSSSSCYIGGLVGYQGTATSVIENSYAIGNVTKGVNSIAGGFIGYLGTSGATISKSFSTGNVDTSNSGGFAGTIISGGIISNAYYHNSTGNPSVCINSGNGDCTGIPEEEHPPHFNEAKNTPLIFWDFINIWSDEEENFPILQWQISEEFSVETNAATNISTSYASLNGQLLILDANWVEVGFEWGLEIDGFTNQTSLQNLTEIGNFTFNLTNLDEGTKYVFRAIAKDEERVRYGEILYFLTEGNLFEDGDGTSGNPFQITSCQQLQNMNTNLTAYYILNNNINCSGTTTWDGNQGFLPIGNMTEGFQFAGSFDGQEFNITDLYISRALTSYVGLFGYATSNSIIKNVGLVDANMLGGGFSGILAGRNYGKINNTFSTGEISSPSYRIGGLVGQNDNAQINNSYSNAKVMGTLASSTQIDIGGLVGYNSGGNLTRCYATGEVTSASTNAAANVGGLVGYSLNTASIIECYATGNVTSSGGGNVGGLVGSHSATGSNEINLSYATGNVSGGGSNVGGLVGINAGTIYNSNSTGYVSSSSSSVGGLVGSNSGTIADSHSIGQTSSSNIYVGGLSGYNSGTIIRCYATGYTLTTNSHVGGLVGIASGGTITDSYATGDVRQQNSAAGGNAGGLVGYNNGGTITRCYSTGYVTSTRATTSAYVGGLVGNALGTSLINQSYSIGNVSAAGGRVGGLVGDFSGTNSRIIDSYSTGNVDTTYSNSGAYIGGFVGDQGTATSVIENSYSIGNVTKGVNSVAGGFVGYVGISGATISKSFSTGNVDASNSGGFAGTVVSGGIISDSYYHNSTGNPSISINSGDGDCTGIPEEEHPPYFYIIESEPMGQWDFEIVWDDFLNTTDYPELRWQEVSKDNIAPEVKITKNASEVEYEIETINITWLAEDDVSLDFVLFNVTYPNGTLLFESNSNNGEIILSPLNLTTLGTYNVNLLANDTSSNFNSTDDSFIVEDTISPIVSLISPENNTLNDTTNTIDFLYNISDSSSIENCSLIIDGGINKTISSPEKNIENNITIYLANGEYLWNINCTDSHNNEGQSEIRNISVNVGEAVSISLSEKLGDQINWTLIFLPTYNQSAEGNNEEGATSYYINISTSGGTADLYVKANSHLMTSGLDVLGIGNETYSFNLTNSSVPSLQKFSLTTNYEDNKIGEDLSDGAVIYLKFFLNAPAAQPAGVYNNTLLFKAVPYGESP